MKLTRSTVKQFALTCVIMILGLLVVNNIALAQTGAISDTDCPQGVSGLGGCGTSLRQTVVTIINYFLGFLGLLAVIMIIYGGFLYVSSAGNEENVGKAKKIILYAAVGIVMIALSYLIVRTILGAATGTPA